MQKLLIEESTRIPANTLLGLDEKQIGARRHLCLKDDATELAGEQLPEGFYAVRLKAATDFKRSEIIYANQVPKTTAALSLEDTEKSSQEPVVVKMEGSEAGEYFAKYTVGKLKDELTRLNAPFNAKDKKPALQATLREFLAAE